jgi:hypothetical protein
VSLNPRDLVTKLKLLFAVVIGLFGAMHVGAFLGYVQEKPERQAYMARLQDPLVGFELQACGAWTWAFEQLPCTEDVGAVPGNFTLLARVLGIPFARLRCAIPEELLYGATHQLAGRKSGLSVSGIKTHAKARTKRLRIMTGGAPAAAVKVDAESEDDDEDASDVETCPARQLSETVTVAATVDVPAQPIQRVAATALMFAAMSMRCLLRESELAERAEATAMYLYHSGYDRDNRFFELLGYFKCMMASDNLRSSGQWFDRARLWRMIFLGHADGWFEPSQGLAFSLQAVNLQPAKVSATRTLMSRLLVFAGASTHALNVAVNCSSPQAPPVLFAADAPSCCKRRHPGWPGHAG